MKRFDDILKGEMNALIGEIQKCVSFNTVQTDPEPGMPFGRETAECLDYVLKLGESMGFSSENFDNYAGHIDWGNGEEILGILGHLDVVPVNPAEWIVPPFSGTLKDGKIYGRGAIDDKGPVMSCLFAMKILRDGGYVPRRKVRLILGCNEESGMKCMEYYLPRVKLPDAGFTPDADFPCIHGERGIYGMDILLGKLPKKVLSLSAGSVVNVVPDKCEALLDLSVDISPLKECGNIRCEKTEKGYLLTSSGISCHGSIPQTGKNAVWDMIKALCLLFPDCETLAFISARLCSDYDGSAWGFPLEDEESGKMSFSLDVLRLMSDGLHGKIDFRFPVTFTHAQLEECVRKNSPDYVRILGGHKSPSLYVSADDPLVRTALDAYEEVMGERKEPLVIGGGTYAKALKNCISIGPEFEGDELTMHTCNEYISVARLEQMTKIYLRVIKKLSE